MDLRGRSLLKEIGRSAGEFRYLVDLGVRLRLERRADAQDLGHYLAG
jgi:hypothetical protein